MSIGKVAVKAIRKFATKTKSAGKSKLPPNAKFGNKTPANDNQKPYANDNTPKKSRSGHPDPDPRAESRSHSIIEKLGKGGQYTTFNKDGTFKQYRGSGKPHGPIERPNIKENIIDPRSPKGLPSKATVRRPTAEEIPRG